MSTEWFDFPRRGGCFARNHFKRSVSARFIAYEASSHRTSPRGSSWVQALPGKFRGNHNPGFDRGNFCPFPGAYLGSHTPGIPGISGSTWEHTHPGAYPGIGTRVFPGGRWEPRNNPGQNLGKTRVLGLSRVFPGWCCWGLRYRRQATARGDRPGIRPGMWACACARKSKSYSQPRFTIKA